MNYKYSLPVDPVERQLKRCPNGSTTHHSSKPTQYFSLSLLEFAYGLIVPLAQVTPSPSGTLEVPYPVQGTNNAGLIAGAVVIVLVVLGGVILTTRIRKSN
jgi:hypothetical protein